MSKILEVRPSLKGLIYHIPAERYCSYIALGVRRIITAGLHQPENDNRYQEYCRVLRALDGVVSSFELELETAIHEEQ